jgi:hypothetical protein
VTSERVADGADLLRADLGVGSQKINRSAVVDDSFNRGAQITAAIDVQKILAEVRVVGGEGDIAAFGELFRIVKRIADSHSNGLILAGLLGLMQTQDRGGVGPRVGN